MTQRPDDESGGAPRASAVDQGVSCVSRKA